MHQPDKNEISLLLAQLDGEGAFATRRTADAGELSVSVRGFGKLAWPIKDTMARKLCKLAQPARHGFKTETRLDKRIRDTWEIASECLTLGPVSWTKALERHLDRLRRDLGLPGTCRLVAKLHNLLIYTPGQFFATHQDSVKSERMVGTLVVVLPSRFSGGELVIEHRGEKLRAGGSEKELTLIAFYADCHHELRPVKSGHRLALTFNLSVKGDTAPGDLAAERLKSLSDAVQEHFHQPRSPRMPGGTPPKLPQKLVYLLDHEYTQRDLSWKRLKNGDARRAAALRHAAEDQDCEIFLALAEVHETWSCEEEDDRGYRRGGYGGYGDDDDEEPESEDSGGSDLDLIELIDHNIELKHWVDAKGGKSEGVGTVAGDELFYTKPSKEFDPFRSEHEGFMGNYGNTADRWYHRAAIVLWPRQLAFAIRAEQSPRWAVTQVTSALKRDGVPTAMELLRQVYPVWEQAVRKDPSPTLLGSTLALAARIEDHRAADTLLRPFSLAQLTRGNIKRMVQVVHAYGPSWSEILFNNWLKDNRFRFHDSVDTWIAKELPFLCQAICGDGDPKHRVLAKTLLAGFWKRIENDLKEIPRFGPKSQAGESAFVIPQLLALLDCGRITGDTRFQNHIVEFLTTRKPVLPEAIWIQILSAADKRGGDSLRELGLQPLVALSVARLTERLDEPLRAPEDWSLTVSLGCSCDLCKKLGRFLKDTRQRRLEWPLAKDHRQHVHGKIDAHERPVLHTTRRTGSPFTLILEKTQEVFSRDLKSRNTWKTELKWLKALG